MNFNGIYAGSVSTNPTLIILGAIVLYGRRAAGWRGADRFLLPQIDAPWAPRRRLRGKPAPPAEHPADADGVILPRAARPRTLDRRLP